MRLPAYPLVTIDPYMSIWSMTDNLYDSDTVLWCGIKKRITGHITIDGEKFRFIGKSKHPAVKQTSVYVMPLITEYIFKIKDVEFSAEFYTPLFLDDLYLLSSPCSFVEYRILKSKTNHNIKIEISLNEEFCYDRTEKIIEAKAGNINSISYAVMGRKYQSPLSKTGDGVSADWGRIYISGGKCTVKSDNIYEICSSHKLNCVNNTSCFNIIAFDDIYSIEYFGKKLKGLWTEKFNNIKTAIFYFFKNKEELYSKALEWNTKIINDAKKFGDDFNFITTCAFRQVLAAHKLVRAENGKLLYFSKECFSNGCINTVDVSYPSIPLFLLYAPDLVEGMMNGICEFARLDIWKHFDFAPHDLGQYPVANGQVYALSEKYNKKRKEIYKYSNSDIYNFEFQMPVEESANMLIIAYAYTVFSKITAFIAENIDLLSRWAEYLLRQGVELEHQLCTDDFAGASSKNVNLAIKSCIAIRCYHEICDILGINSTVDYKNEALINAKKLCELSGKNGYLNFSIDDDNTWSLKYNLVWDLVFKFGLFDESIFENESAKYNLETNKYGVPLDYRNVFTKTDWLIWASCLDKTGKNIKTFSECLAKFLKETTDRCCFTDCIMTDSGKKWGMEHRSVQGGLWMPLLLNNNTN